MSLFERPNGSVIPALCECLPHGSVIAALDSAKLDKMGKVVFSHGPNCCASPIYPSEAVPVATTSRSGMLLAEGSDNMLSSCRELV